MIDVPAIIEEHEFALAEERMLQNKRFSTRNTKHHTLLQGLVICGGCGYACCRATVRRKRGATHYYRCIGSGGHPVRGRLCTAAACEPRSSTGWCGQRSAACCASQSSCARSFAGALRRPGAITPPRTRERGSSASWLAPTRAPRA